MSLIGLTILAYFALHIVSAHVKPWCVIFTFADEITRSRFKQKRSYRDEAHAQARMPLRILFG